ncbi:MAG TPA: hypothetical protein VFO16_11505 [Pseudonocardiaceae bacterium]|nr:hypothetical protein [Pseudonocardiaceae bacterium]
MRTPGGENEPGSDHPAVRLTVLSYYQPESIWENADTIITTGSELDGIESAYQTYQEWGWPVSLRGDQVRLETQADMVGLIIPTLLATELTTTLAAQRSSPPVVVHPAAPTHRMLVCSEPFAVALPWPPAVLRVDPPLLLPPTPTPRGPLAWGNQPHPHGLRLCREIDAFAALRTLLKDLLFPPP